MKVSQGMLKLILYKRIFEMVTSTLGLRPSQLDQKYKTNSGDKHFKNMHFMNLTFRMLVNIHFQKYNL